MEKWFCFEVPPFDLSRFLVVAQSKGAEIQRIDLSDNKRYLVILKGMLNEHEIQEIQS